MKLSAAFVVLSSALVAIATTPATILSDIQGITTQTQTLDTSIKAITTTNIAGALAVHTAAGNLVTSINSATADSNLQAVTPKPVSEADGTSILNAVKALQPVITTTLSDLVAKNATIAAIPITGLSALVLQLLKNLNTATGAFETSLLASAPSDIQTAAAPVISAINSAMSSAIDAFS
ncbi:hydrophobic surface binding protein A-domain-containing protein [Panaeolus papilionaceus]|nr:hydrophobic surface binding protein A-domain-containing protein [Panaeolus papilionaceus]